MTGSRSAKPADQKAAADKAAGLCLQRLFERQVALNPDSPAVSCGDVTISYAELNRQANRLAAELIGAGVVADSPVGLSMARSADLIVGLLGILKAGGAYVPLDPGYPPDRLAHILDQAAPAVIVCRSDLQGALPASTARIVDIDKPGSTADENPDVAVSPDHLCYLIFTSGSTGTPKGVMVTHRNVARLFSTISQQIEFRDDDIWTLFHSYAFGYSAWEIFGALLHGAHLVIVPDEARADPKALYRLLKENRVTVFSQTPSAFRQLLLDRCFANSNAELSLRQIVFSGEAVVTKDLENWYAVHGDNGPLLVNTYAITETGGQVAFRSYADGDIDESRARNIGLPLADTRVHILDANLRPVKPGAAGELCVGGPGLARGYINQPELTAEKFIELELGGKPERIYRTGDQARRLDSGEIEFLGRTDNQVKVRGHRIELGDIENCLGANPAVREVAVMLRGDGSGEPRLVAYIAATDASRPPTVTALREHVQQSLPEYMAPALFVFLEHLPLNPNGKLDRKALPAPGHARPELAVAYAAPESRLQKELACSWAEALGLEKVGIHDNFFELGGDSILALKLTSRLRQLLGEYVYISALIDAPTVAELAERLSDEFPNAAANIGANAVAADEALPAVVPHHAERFDTFPLTDIQQAYFVGRGGDFAMGNVSTHLYIEVDATDLDLPRLERAWQKVIDRHPMLRAIVLPARARPAVTPGDTERSLAAVRAVGLTHAGK
ncbi:MAG: amino acid adenylation domain-containing protein [Gammaproteobacteria bacterium]